MVNLQRENEELTKEVEQLTKSLRILLNSPVNLMI